MKPEQAVRLRSLDVPKLLVGHSALKRQCLRAVLVPHGVNVEETLPVAEPVAADGDRPRSPDVGGIVSHPVDSAEADDHLPAKSTTSWCETQPPVVHAHLRHARPLLGRWHCHGQESPLMCLHRF